MLSGCVLHSSPKVVVYNLHGVHLAVLSLYRCCCSCTGKCVRGFKQAPRHEDVQVVEVQIYALNKREWIASRSGRVITSLRSILHTGVIAVTVVTPGSRLASLHLSGASSSRTVNQNGSSQSPVQHPAGSSLTVAWKAIFSESVQRRAIGWTAGDRFPAAARYYSFFPKRIYSLPSLPPNGQRGPFPGGKATGVSHTSSWGGP